MPMQKNDSVAINPETFMEPSREKCRNSLVLQIEGLRACGGWMSARARWLRPRGTQQNEATLRNQTLPDDCRKLW